MELKKAKRELRWILKNEKTVFSELQIATDRQGKVRILQAYETRLNKFLKELEKQKDNPEFKPIYDEAENISNWANSLRSKGIFKNIQRRMTDSNLWENLD